MAKPARNDSADNVTNFAPETEETLYDVVEPRSLEDGESMEGCFLYTRIVEMRDEGKPPHDVCVHAILTAGDTVTPIFGGALLDGKLAQVPAGARVVITRLETVKASGKKRLMRQYTVAAARRPSPRALPYLLPAASVATPRALASGEDE